jgi:hypothetical protein
MACYGDSSFYIEDGEFLYYLDYSQFLKKDNALWASLLRI